MNNKTKGIIFMCLSALAFSVMQVIIGMTSDRIPLFEQLFFRNLVASIVAYINIKKQKLKAFGSKENRNLLLGRTFMGYFGMITLFYASGNGSQGDVSIITKMSPFVVTICAFLFLKEKITKFQIIGLIIAFIGAFFVVNPQFNSNIFPLIVAGIASIFSGLAYVFVSLLKGKENPSVIIFVFSFISTVITFPIMMLDFVKVSIFDGFLLILIGISAAIGQILLTYSYACSKASEVSIYNYVGIIFSMILGYVFLGEELSNTSILGAVLVILSSLIVYFGNMYEEKLYTQDNN